MTNTLKNDRLIRALYRQPVDRTPVWIMRQAGRYLPEYRELRKKARDFMQFCQTPTLACEATLQPLRRFPLDAAIIFSDILTVPQAMGMRVEFVEGEGPVLGNPIKTLSDVDKLKIPDTKKDFDYVFEAIELTRNALQNEIPLIGFSGSPWTLASYMIEGGGSKTFRLIKMMSYQKPEVLKALLDRLTEVVSTYLIGQVEAGAQVLMVFDSWGGILSAPEYEEFSLYYLKKIAADLKPIIAPPRIPLIFFSKGANHSLESMAQSGCDAVGLDSTINISEARRRIGHQVALQGNLDPFALFQKPELIKKSVHEILSQFGKHPGHVFNLGHGIDLATPIESVHAMLEAVQHGG